MSAGRQIINLLTQLGHEFRTSHLKVMAQGNQLFANFVPLPVAQVIHGHMALKPFGGPLDQRLAIESSVLAFRGRELVHAGHHRILGFLFVVFGNGLLHDQFLNGVNFLIDQICRSISIAELGLDPANRGFEIEMLFQHHRAFGQIGFADGFAGLFNQVFVQPIAADFFQVPVAEIQVPPGIDEA